MNHLYLSSASLAIVLILTACASKPTNPTGDFVSDGKLSFAVGGRYQVKSGDTVSKIAKEFNMDWRELSAFNHLDSKHTIYAGQWLNIPATGSNLTAPSNPTQAQQTNPQPTTPKPTTPVVVVPMPAPSTTNLPAVVSPPVLGLGFNATKAPNPAAMTPNATPPNTTTPNNTPPNQDTPTHKAIQANQTQAPQFRYPVGQDNLIVKGFGVPIPNGKTEGIFFVGNVGDGIFASDTGTIVYANASPNGNNRPMVVIDHNNGYVSTYFDVGAILVKVGDGVNKGDRLGGMTPQTKSGKALFEFRIAQSGRYVDPMTVIK